MKLGIKTEEFMEEFVADEEDKELARVAFRRAEAAVNRRMRNIAIFFLVIGVPLVLFFDLSFYLRVAAIAFGVIFTIVFIFLFRNLDSIFLHEYNKQLLVLKLQIRGEK